MSKRRPFRKSNGRFRRGTIADFGMNHCENCGRFYEIKEPEISDSGFVNPVAMAQVRNAPCPHCKGEDE